MRARKRFAQHFLEAPWVAKLVEAVAPQPSETFIEIGPGTGALTLPLASRAGRVLGIEIDRDLAAGLRSAAPPNVEVIDGDVLDMDLAGLMDSLAPGPEAPPSKLRVVGNLPYNVSSPILFRLLGANHEKLRWSDATLMLQEEVAERIVAGPGGRDYGVVSVLAAAASRAKLLFALPPGAFRPMPRVRSAVVRLDARPAPAGVDLEAFEALVRHLFLERRKTVLNRLSAFLPGGKAAAAEVLAQAGIDPARRPETLDLSEIRRLLETMASSRGAMEMGETVRGGRRNS